MAKILGLKRGIVRLVSYNPNWHELFLHEKNALREILAEKFLAMEHIGSTSIPQIKSKPIMDLMLAIPDLDNWHWIDPFLSKLDYQFRQNHIKEQGHVLFVKGSEHNRTHYLKICELNSEFWKDQIIFRDYLISNPNIRSEYESLKKDLLQQFPDNRELYTKGKAGFIQKILNQAKTKEVKG